MSATPQALWARLASAGLASGEMPPVAESPTPWYVRLMLCIAGFIAALFLLGFIGVGFAFVMESRIAAAAVGLMLVVAAFAIFRAAPRSDFGAMFGLAVSLAGQGLFTFGFLALFERSVGSGAWLTIALLEIGLAIVMPNYLHRVISAYAAGLALMYAFISLGAGFLAAGLACVVAWLWLNEAPLAKRQSMLVPIAYGLTLAFIHIEGMPFFGREWMAMPGIRVVSPWGAPWMGEVLVAGALIATVIVLVRRSGWAWEDRKAMFAIAAAAAVGAASLKAPGIAGGLMIAILGHANGNRVLLGLGVAGLLFYASAYYYLLAVTLLVKSAVLAATGAVLLAVRAIVLKTVIPEDRQDA